MTDPLAMPGRDDSENDSEHLEQKAIDQEHASISRGMPARNLKQWGMMAIGLLFLGYLAWPSIFSKREAVLDGGQSKQQAQNQPGLIVAQLEAQPRTPAASQSVDSTPAAPNPSLYSGTLPGPKAGLSGSGNSTSSAVGPDGNVMTVAELTEKRVETIRSSSMEANEVSIPAKKTAGATSDPRSALADSLDKQTAMLEKTLGSGAQVAKVDQPQQVSEKEAFVLKARTVSTAPAVQIGSARKPNSLYQGTIIRVVLDRSINTDHPGEFRAHVKSDVFDSINQSTLLIPRGSVALGPYQSSLLVGDARILLAGSRLILPNGKSMSLMGAPASDTQGSSGIPAEINNHFFDMFKASFVVGAASLLLPKNDQNITVTSSAQGSQTGGSILGTTLYDTIKQIASRNANIKPTGIIELGEEFTFILTHDVEMEPYGKLP